MLFLTRFVGLVIRHLVLGAVVFGVNGVANAAESYDTEIAVDEFSSFDESSNPVVTYVLSKGVAFSRTLPIIANDEGVGALMSDDQKRIVYGISLEGVTTRSNSDSKTGAAANQMRDFFQTITYTDNTVDTTGGGNNGQPPTISGTPSVEGEKKYGYIAASQTQGIEGERTPVDSGGIDFIIKVISFKFTSPTDGIGNHVFTKGEAITPITFSDTADGTGAISYDFLNKDNLPAGLTLNGRVLSGIPTETTTAPAANSRQALIYGATNHLRFRFTATDATPNTILSDEFTITVNAVPDNSAPVFTPATFDDQTIQANTDVNIALPTATGGDGGLFYSLTTPADFPTGLTLTFTTNGVPTITGRAGITGTFSVTLKAADSDNNTADSDAATLSFDLIITESLSVKAQIPDQFIIVGATSSAIDMTQYFNNPTNAGIGITVTGDGGKFTADISGANVTLTGVSAGVVNAIVKVADSADATIFVDLPMTVTVVVAATADAGSDQGAGTTKIYKGDTVSLSGSGGGGNDASTYAWSEIDSSNNEITNSDITFIDASAAATTFTAPAGSRTLNIRLTVTNNGGTASDTVAITISNQAPVADAGGNKTIDEGASVTLDGSGSDLEGDAITYAWTPSTGLTGADTGSPTFTAPNNLKADKDFVFSLTVTAGGVDSVASIVTVTVTGVNDKPTADAGEDQGTNPTIAEGATVVLDGSRSRDSEGEDLSYAWTAPDNIILIDATSVTPTFTAPSQLVNNRPIVFSLTVTTAAGVDSKANTVTITVTAGANEPPTADAGGDRSVSEDDPSVTLSGSGDDPESEEITVFTWTVPAGITFSSGENTATPTFTPPNVVADTTYVVSLIVRTAAGAESAPNTVTITVTGDNDKPTADAGNDDSVGEGKSFQLSGSGTDPEDEKITVFTWTAPAGITLSDVTIANPTFTAPTQLMSDDTLVFELKVTDANKAESDANTVSIVVTAGPNDPPDITGVKDKTVAIGSKVMLTATAIDLEGESMTYRWKATDTGGFKIDITDASGDVPADGSISASFIAPTVTADTNFRFSLIVTDARNLSSAAAAVTITIRAGGNFKILHEQILTKLNQAVVASTMESVIARGDTIFSKGRKSASYTFDGQTWTLGDGANFKVNSGKIKQYYQNISAGKMNWKKILGNSSFSTPLNYKDGGIDQVEFTFWGRGSYKHLTGNKAVKWDGDLTNLQIGIDGKINPNIMLGGMLAWSDAEVDYTATGGAKDNQYNHSMVSIHPYASWKNEVLTVWGLVGLGTGDLEIIQNQQKSIADTQMISGSFGIKGKVLPILFVKGDVSIVNTKVKANPADNIAKQSVISERIRFIVEGKKTYRIFGGNFTPAAEAGLRYDLGDGATGAGAELGGGIRYNSPGNGIIITSKARTLLGQSGYREWGVGGAIRFQQGTGGRGLSFKLEPSYGDTKSDKNSVFNNLNRHRGDNQATANYSSQIKTSLSYGMDGFNHKGIFKVYSTMLFNDSKHQQTVGVDWTSRNDFSLNLNTSRTLNKNTTDNKIKLQGSLRF